LLLLLLLLSRRWTDDLRLIRRRRLRSHLDDRHLLPLNRHGNAWPEVLSRLMHCRDVGCGVPIPGRRRRRDGRVRGLWMQWAKGLLLLHLLLELLGIHSASGRLGVNREAGAGAGGRLRRKLLHWRISQHSRLQTRRRLLNLTRNTGEDLSLLIRRDHRGRPDHPCTAWTHHDVSATAATGHGAEPGLKMRMRVMICLSWATGIRLLLLDTGMTRGLGNQLHRQLAVLRLLVSGGRGRDRDTASLNGHLLLL